VGNIEVTIDLLAERLVNSVYLSMSRDVIRTNCVQVFCVDTEPSWLISLCITMLINSTAKVQLWFTIISD